MTRPIRITYVTSNNFKKLENERFCEVCSLRGRPVRDLFSFDIRPVPIKEILEVDIELMVQQEVVQAYKELKVPCVVEHAGLVFEDLIQYPGGLTKPMWNTLKGEFLDQTGSKGKAAAARAVVAYCDGMNVHTFVGETEGTISDSVRGSRDFYWDTVFIPNTTDPAALGKTYAEIVDDPKLGLDYKIVNLSQSTRAMLKFLEYRIGHTPVLWPRS